jgi:hypothetical protein
MRTLAALAIILAGGSVAYAANNGSFIGQVGGWSAYFSGRVANTSAMTAQLSARNFALTVQK